MVKMGCWLCWLLIPMVYVSFLTLVRLGSCLNHGHAKWSVIAYSDTRLSCLLCLVSPFLQLLHVGKQTQEHLWHGLLLLPLGTPQHQGM